MPGIHVVENLLSGAGTGTATGSHPQVLPQLYQVIDAAGGSPADLLVGNGFADTHVHNSGTWLV